MLIYLSEYGACSEADPELFFLVGNEDSRVNQRQIREAKQVCAACPVKLECRDWAIASGKDTGIWGGATPRERRALNQRRNTEAEVSA